MRQRTKRRWLACFGMLVFTLLIWWLISSYRNFHRPDSSAKFSSDDVPLKVFVVEEHEEVLTYWSDAFIHGALPPNSTLLHIDAHSDDGLPRLLPAFPNFHPPRSKLQVARMIQANDRFIRTAQITHMLSRTVWIYPFWNKEEKEHYADANVDIGYTLLRGKKVACECYEDGAYSCVVRDEESSSSEPMVRIPARRCAIRRRHLQLEMMRDIYAVTHLPALPDWFANDHLVLDIDLDFFGVKLVGQYLLDSGIRWSDVTAVSACIRKMLCPTDPRDEPLADRWFYGFVSALMTSCHTTENLPNWCGDSKAAVEKFYWPFRSDARSSKMFCTASKSPAVDVVGKRSFIRMWTILRRLTSKQQLEVRRAGICLVQSMRSVIPPLFRLCIGHNTPNNSAVTAHYPSPAELSQQFDRFHAILAALSTRPRLVTVARSSRDGYVPRDLQAELEQRVLQILRDVFKPKEEDIIFDEFMLNGRRGDWYRRTY